MGEPGVIQSGAWGERPVNIIPAAAAGPMARGSSQAPPSAGTSPMRTKLEANCADCEALRMSHMQARSRPTPIAGPLADVIGVRTWFLAGGLITIAMAIVGFFVPSLIRLEEQRAPATVQNFVGLATGTLEWKEPKTGQVMTGQPIYNGIRFHRVIPEFTIQCLSPIPLRPCRRAI